MGPIVLTVRPDNFVYVHGYESGHCWIVDPAEVASVKRSLDTHRLVPTHILVTHHHADHTGGVASLKKAFGCLVVSSDSARIPQTDAVVEDGFSLALGRWTLKVLATPGHTTSSICYYGTHPDQPPVLYSGDTLFACGCGRLCEGTAEMMFESLMRLAALPEQTRVYPGHNYTEENIRFALTLEPDNPDLKQLILRIQKGSSDVPTTLCDEKRCNPFLRTAQAAIQQAVHLYDPVKVFAELRRRKDRF